MIRRRRFAASSQIHFALRGRLLGRLRVLGLAAPARTFSMAERSRSVIDFGSRLHHFSLTSRFQQPIRPKPMSPPWWAGHDRTGGRSRSAPCSGPERKRWILPSATIRSGGVRPCWRMAERKSERISVMTQPV